MTAKSKISAAVRMFWAARALWEWEYYRCRVRPWRPIVNWSPGEGWVIEADVYDGTADQIVAHFDRLTRETYQQIRDHGAGQDPAMPLSSPTVQIQAAAQGRREARRSGRRST